MFDGAIQVLFDNSAISQIAFSLFCLFSENVAMVGMMSLDFTGAGQSESLLGGGLSFNFRHFFLIFKVYNEYLLYVTFWVSEP